jgi:hypothetical protein
MMINQVKDFLKIKFENNSLSLRFMTEMQKLKCISQTVLDGSAFNETILVQVHHTLNNLLKPISHQLGQNFQGAIEQ